MRIARLVLVGALITELIPLAAPGLASANFPAGDSGSLADQLAEAGELIGQGLEKMATSLSTALRELPQYDLPRIDENGDIIIRRKRPDGQDRSEDRRGRPGERSVAPGRPGGAI